MIPLFMGSVFELLIRNKSLGGGDNEIIILTSGIYIISMGFTEIVIEIWNLHRILLKLMVEMYVI